MGLIHSANKRSCLVKVVSGASNDMVWIDGSMAMDCTALPGALKLGLTTVSY